MQKREGFSPQEKAVMVLARETREGIEVTGVTLNVNQGVFALCHESLFCS